MRQVYVSPNPVNTTFSDHHGVSGNKPNVRLISQMLSSFIPLKGESIYSQIFSIEKCMLSPWQSNLFGFNESIFDIHRIIDLVHPMDVDQVWKLSQKAMDLIYSADPKHRRFIFRSTYRILHKGHQYIRILRETAPLLFDDKGRIIASVSRTTDISHLGHHKEIKGWLTLSDRTLDLVNEWKQLLSKREKEVLTYLARGFSSKTISCHLNISKLTVDKHRANMLRKTHTRNTSELIHLAIEKGILE